MCALIVFHLSSSPTYCGGNNYYYLGNGDVIGNATFNILSATRVGAGHNTLEITINTNYAGGAGTAAAAGRVRVAQYS